MPSVKEIYRKITDVTIDADTINLNTDDVESLLSTVQADIAEIKNTGILNGGTVPVSVDGGSIDINSGFLSGLKDGDGNTFGIDRGFPVDVQNTVTVSGPVSTYPAQGSSISTSNFTSTTASTSLVSAVSGREVLTVYNEGSGVLHISVGGTCTTTSYQVRLSAGDYWECPEGQLSLAHTAVFATAGTARVTQVS